MESLVGVPITAQANWGFNEALDQTGSSWRDNTLVLGNGNNRYLLEPDMQCTGGTTVELVVGKAVATPSQQLWIDNIYSREIAYGYGFRVWLNNNSMSISAKGSTCTNTSNVALTTSNLVYCVAMGYNTSVISPGKLKIRHYRSGNTYTESSIDFNDFSACRTSGQGVTYEQKFYIGYNNHFSGWRIGMLRIWSRILSNAELMRCYQNCRARFKNVI